MRIACIHQSADLYGSDRSFLQVIQYLLQSKRFDEITVLLPKHGPLASELKKLDVQVKFMSLSLISKTYLKKLQLNKIIFPLFSLRKKYNFLSNYDIVYTNTSVILDLYLLAPFLKGSKILHIREIPLSPLNHLLSFLIKKADWTVLFNSFSTKNAFKVFKKSFVIHNAFEGFYNADSLDSEEIVLEKPQEIKLLLIGRINHWKGQDFAVEALAALQADENIKMRIVGSTSEGNEHLLVELNKKISLLNLEERVQIVDFLPDPAQEFAWADVIIVPSKKPEPFGRIAIEAMSLGKPVIAANHGGLPEIVSHGQSGFLFSPSNITEFISYLRKYYYNRNLLKIHGAQSLKLYKEKFSINVMYKKLDKVFNTL